MSTLKADTIVASDGTSPVTLTKQSAAKQWVNFDASSTVVIRQSQNTSSITDTAQGRFTINVTSSYSDVYYVISGSAGNLTGTTTVARTTTRDGEWTTSATQFRDADGSASAQDDGYIGVSTMGDLA